MYTGSCLCGTVRFEISGPIRDIVCCHCSRCRKAQGSAFATNGNVSAAQFRFLTGEDNLSAYRSSAQQTKYFCRSCGSPMLSRSTRAPELVRVRLGTLDSEISERPVAHTYVDSKACWEDIDAALPRIAGALPEVLPE